MNVKEMIDELRKLPQDMEVIGGSDKHEYPTELYIESGHYFNEENSEWTSDDDVKGKEVVVIMCSY